MTIIRTIAFTTFHDHTGNVRIRCCFCSAILFEHHGDLDQQEGLALIQQIREHPCYQPGADNGFRQLRHNVHHG